jgi:hypothetical protein
LGEAFEIITVYMIGMILGQNLGLLGDNGVCHGGKMMDIFVEKVDDERI